MPIAIKPTYSAIPLTHDEHQLQHNEGYSILGDEEWWQKMKILYVSTWAWETLKESLGYESWAQVPPEELRDWAASNAVLRYLPNCYKDILTDGQSKDAVEA